MSELLKFRGRALTKCEENIVRAWRRRRTELRANVAPADESRHALRLRRLPPHELAAGNDDVGRSMRGRVLSDVWPGVGIDVENVVRRFIDVLPEAVAQLTNERDDIAIALAQLSEPQWLMGKRGTAIGADDARSALRMTRVGGAALDLVHSLVIVGDRLVDASTRSRCGRAGGDEDARGSDFLQRAIAVLRSSHGTRICDFLDDLQAKQVTPSRGREGEKRARILPSPKARADASRR
ncbi:MAG TPA: hypothetical protein PLV92_23540, partial [Pirellulaceae bacterium]|nr:hypothetical protein [Pirellulaceae bacterium]